jgi:hypothetical protein
VPDGFFCLLDAILERSLGRCFRRLRFGRGCGWFGERGAFDAGAYGFLETSEFVAVGGELIK